MENNQFKIVLSYTVRIFLKKKNKERRKLNLIYRHMSIIEARKSLECEASLSSVRHFLKNYKEAEWIIGVGILTLEALG